MQNSEERIDFPEVLDVDIAFGGYPEEWFKEALKIESKRKYNEMASILFFQGGKVPVNESLPKDYQSKGLRLLKAIIGSFKPRHEDKEHVCGIILENLCKE